MILDNIQNLKRHNILKNAAILNFIQSHDCANLPDGEIAIEGKELFVKIMSYEPKAADQNKFETHQVHADVQYMVRGTELMQVAPSDVLTPTTAYDKEGDYQFYQANDAITDLVVRQGEFTYFYPGEAHRPSCVYKNQRGAVKKLVFKIKIA